MTNSLLETIIKSEPESEKHTFTIKEFVMSENKAEILKAILSIRRKLSHIKLDVNREVDRFEEQFNKSLKRIDKIGYLSAKFTVVELIQTQKAYEALINPMPLLKEEKDSF